MTGITKNKQYYKFSLYGFLKNLRFFDAFFILFLIEKELSFTQIGLLYAVREIVINVLEVPSGIFADKFGRKKSLVGSFVFYIASFLVFHFSASFWLFFIAFILFGIGDAFRTGTHKGMIMDYLRINGWSNQKIEYYGHTRSWSQKGSALSALLAGLLVFYSGKFSSIFLYSVVPYLFNLVLILSYPKVLDKSLKQKKNERKKELNLTIKSLFKVVRQQSVLKIINTSALHSAYLKSLKDYIQPLIINVALLIPLLNNFDIEKKNGAIIGVIYFFIFLLSSKASKMASKANQKQDSKLPYFTLLIGFCAGIISGITYLFSWWVVSLIAFIAIYLIENFRKPILTGYVSDSVPEEILASVISVQSLLKTVFTAVIAFVFGVLADFSGLGIALIATSLFLLLLTQIINVLTKSKKHYKAANS
jgi:MFS family permease